MTKLLIIDDDEQNLYQLRILLQASGYEVISAANGAEALEKALHDLPGLVIADILMPGMDGFALCRQWQADDRLKTIPLVFYTATYTDVRDEEFALSLGAARFIRKPIEPDEFVETLREVIEEHQVGHLIAPRKPVAEEAAYLKVYNETLIRKLEDKMAQVEQANQALERYAEEVIRQRDENARLYEQVQRYAVDLEQRVAERTAELQLSNEELQQFAYIVSHDLQEPLRTVASFMQLLAKQYQGKLDTSAEEYITFAVEGTTRMQQLITDLLSYVQAGNQEQKLAAVDSEALLVHTLDDLRLVIAESDAEVTHDPLPTVHGDAVRLGQVFQNLIGNALKFRGQTPPRIHVSAQQEPTQWIFSIRDNGIGINPQQAERIFGVFQRLHTPKEYPGTGIGLAICKKIIERHGGRIWMESTPGQGTTFFFSLPVRTDPEQG